ncbi:MAG: glutamate synthase large subunit, partial [Thiohalomonadales bacterium]
HLAALGITKLQDLIGRTDLLKILEGNTPKQRQLDMTALLDDGGIGDSKPHYCQVTKNEAFDKGEMAEQMVNDTLDAITHQRGGEFSYAINNTNRSIGARISGEIAIRYGNNGMKDKPIHLSLTGTAGQSFGVWNAGGLNMTLTGDANDYVGKGMAGGNLIIRPAANVIFESHKTTIIGNTCLYGATGGRLFASGLAGERFAVRNSGAVAVIEGVGDHCCEYMTGGVIAVLGKSGINFAAGMTGGIALVIDEDGQFEQRCNMEFIEVLAMNTDRMDSYRDYFFKLVTEFVEQTNSRRGFDILENFSEWQEKLLLVKPKALNLDALLSDIENTLAA